MGTNDDRRSRKLACIMGEVYHLVNTGKTKFPGSRQVPSGFLRSGGVILRCAGTANNRLEWVARSLGATFLDMISWIRDLDFGRGGLHIIINGPRELGDRHCRVCGTESESWNVLNS